jgi:hypothetical protein
MEGFTKKGFKLEKSPNAFGFNLTRLSVISADNSGTCIQTPWLLSWHGFGFPITREEILGQLRGWLSTFGDDELLEQMAQVVDSTLAALAEKVPSSSVALVAPPDPSAAN